MVARSLAWVLATCVGLAVGCAGTQTVPAASPSPPPSVSPVEEARQVMASFNIALPAGAQDVRVARPPLDDFRDKVVVSFVAPRDQVLNETCKSMQSKGFNLAPILVYPADEMLEFAGATIDATDYGSCDQYDDKRKSIVLIPKVDGNTTYVVLYHMAVR